MKYFLVLLSLSFFSCAHPQKEFVKEVNCSRNALDYLGRETAKANSKTSQEVIKPQIKTILEAHSPKFKSCYDEHVLHKGFRDSYNVCTILKFDELGKTDYIYVDDATQGLDEKFRKCMIDEISSIDFSGVKITEETVIFQSFDFYSVR